MSVERVEIDLAGSVSRVTTIEEGQTYEVAVIFQVWKVASGEFETTVVVHTDLQERPLVTWNIKGTILLLASGDPAPERSQNCGGAMRRWKAPPAD